MSVIQTNLHTLMQKEISRKEFLSMVSVALLSIGGLGTILKLLPGTSLDTHRMLTGYGGSVYGGLNRRGRL